MMRLEVDVSALDVLELDVLELDSLVSPPVVESSTAADRSLDSVRSLDIQARVRAVARVIFS